ncbi:hypothetical protein [Kribbella shirazensis]|uniref:Uncharacterized protein n=1 Tax=Kribbella shirazensis TaxID=1105143 RepID=A0A7X5ZYH3_9ACTN|nr:hypothetical protein [Kribbella shirazensis]NIK54650.1 hypothetical protein [Kribbella shirazensis]
MASGTTSRLAVEWGGEPNETGWPTLRPTERCDGENPMTGSACINGHHKGYHRDASGAEWLDDE